MYFKAKKKTVIVAFIVLLALLAAVMVVSAAGTSGGDSAIAKVDPYGNQGVTVLPVSGTDHLLISPWGIDATTIGV